MICTPHRGSSLTCAHLSCPYMQCVFLFDFELSIPSNFLFSTFILNLLHFLLHFFHYLEGRSNTAYFAWKEMDSTDESFLLTHFGGARALIHPHGSTRRPQEGKSDSEGKNQRRLVAQGKGGPMNCAAFDVRFSARNESQGGLDLD